jgi:hypothetical protein
MIKTVLEGLVIGIVAGFVIIYAFRPREAYPRWLLKIYAYPWMFLVLIAAIAVVSSWSLEVAALLTIITVAMFADLIVFGKPIPQRPTEVADHIPESVTIPGVPLTSVPLSVPHYPLFDDAEFKAGDPAPFS